MTGGRALVLVATLVAAGAGCGRQVEVVIAPRDGCAGGCGSADLSCVGGLEVLLIGQGEEPVLDRRCVDLEPSADNHDLCDNRFADAISMTVVDGTEAVEIWGRGEGEGCTGVPLFVARAEYSGSGDVLDALATCPLLCAERDLSWSHQFWLDRVDDGTPPPVDPELHIGVGMLWDAISFLVPGEHGAVQYAGYPIGHEQPVAADGHVEVAGARFAVLPDADRCLAASMEQPGRRPQQLCLQPEVPEVSDSLILWLDPITETRFQQFADQLLLDPPRPAGAGYSLGVVRDQAGQPLAGAHVDQLPAGVRVVYPQQVGEEITETPDFATGDQGWFLLLDPFVGRVTIGAPPGHQTVTVPAAASWDSVGAQVIVLPDVA